MSDRLPAALFVVLLIAAAAFVTSTADALPARVATHFDSGGTANGYMTRDGYRIFMLAFSVGFPLVLVALIAGLPRLAPNLTNVPNRDYWLVPERREAALAALRDHALWLGCLSIAVAAGVHDLIIRANAQTPPRLDNGLFIALLGAFCAGLVLWIFMLLRRFRKPS